MYHIVCVLIRKIKYTYTVPIVFVLIKRLVKVRLLPYFTVQYRGDLFFGVSDCGLSGLRCGFCTKWFFSRLHNAESRSLNTSRGAGDLIGIKSSLAGIAGGSLNSNQVFSPQKGMKCSKNSTLAVYFQLKMMVRLQIPLVAASGSRSQPGMVWGFHPQKHEKFTNCSCRPQIHWNFCIIFFLLSKFTKLLRYILRIFVTLSLEPIYIVERGRP